ncbi:MAG: phospholipase D family protein [Spirochaetaceae bacterium]|nr:phospholipase D family protein [Spirochaetaceae bacterium]
MIRFSLIRPLDQPPNKRRLLRDLKAALQDSRFTHFSVVVAYAKSGPLARLQPLLLKWRSARKTSIAVFGIDQQGTTKDALDLALQLFDRVYITSEPGITFHPKLYIFKGPHDAHAFVGSNNLTVGGTEKNFETAVHLELDLPEDAAHLNTIESALTDLLPTRCPATRQLDLALLSNLAQDGLILDESATRRRAFGDGDAATVARPRPIRTSRLPVLPESPLPRSQPTRTLTTPQKRRLARSSHPGDPPLPSSSARALVIQIKPHHNGEIFLSMTAVKQNPAFFKWPFTGTTTPKKPNNPSYPQLLPDPIVNITVYGRGLSVIEELERFRLNTVYYAKRSELRVTASPLVRVVPAYSVMIMEHSVRPEISYEITIHRPDSPEFNQWLDSCNQSMPGGGTQPRKYGWF